MPSANFPYQSTPFVGRRAEIAELITLLNDPACRLLTLVGPGGIGKTRLAIEIALHKRNDFPNGVFFVSLQSLTSSEYLVPALADGLDLSLSVQEAAHVQLLDFLRRREMLLILDNTEHLPGAADLIQQILLAAPRLKLFVTSRETLNLREEWLYSVEGLSYPTDTGTEDAEAYSAVQLFVSCARRLRPDFTFTGQRAAVIRICQLVDGMPLALELAATWIKVLPCIEIVAEIQKSLEILATNQRNMPERHKSVKAVFDYSWKLLGEEEQTVFKRLSIFRGGFQRAAVMEVLGASLDSLAALVDKSMLRVDGSGLYTIHELLQQYAEEKLNETPNVKKVILNRHGEYYARFLNRLEPYLESGQQRHALKEISGQIGNVRAAWNHNVKQKKAEPIRQSLQVLVDFYAAYAWYQEGANAFALAADKFRRDEPEEASGALLGRLLTAQGICCNWLGQKDRATALFREGLRLTRAYGNQGDQVRTLNEVGLAAYQRGDFRQAQAWFQESLSIATTINANNLLIHTYHYLCLAHQPLGEYKRAQQAGEAGVELCRKLDHSSGLYSILTTLGILPLKLGSYQQAEQLLQEATAITGQVYTVAEQARHLEILGTISHALGDYEQANQRLETSLTLAREADVPRRISWSLSRLGELAYTMGRYHAAQERFQEGLQLARQIGQVWQQILCLRGLGRVAYSLGNYTEARRLQLENLTLCSATELQAEIANILNDLALTITALGDGREARHYFSEALKIGHSIQALPTVLAVLAGAAELFRIDGEYVYALESLTFVLHHPASHAETRQYAARLLIRLQAELSSETYVQVQQSSQPGELEVIMMRVLNALAATPPDGSRSSMFDSLTRREREVLRLLATRRTNQEIADILVISVGTVKTHVHNICDKLCVSDRRQAAARAKELHLI